MNSYRKRGKEHPLIVLKAHFLMFKLAPICYSDSFTPFKIIQMEYQLIFRVLTIYWIMVLIASYVWHHWISLKNSQDRYYYFHITDEDIRTHQGRHTTKGYGVSIWGRKDINLNSLTPEFTLLPCNAGDDDNNRINISYQEPNVFCL